MPSVDISDKSYQVLNLLAKEQLIDSSMVLDRFIQGWCAMSLALMGQEADKNAVKTLPLPRPPRTFKITLTKPNSDSQVFSSETVSGLLTQFVEYLDPKKIYACLLNHDMEADPQALVQDEESEDTTISVTGTNQRVWHVYTNLSLKDALVKMRDLSALMNVQFDYDVG